MEFSRLHAFAVEPSRRTGLHEPPEGGRVPTTRALTRVLNRAIDAASFDTRTRVAFRVAPETRTNEVRDLLLAYAFGDDDAASDAAIQMANRLATSMDQRSPIGLFVMSATLEDPVSTVFLWMFPRDEAFRFRSGPTGPSIQVLTDVFSQTSLLRKGARFNGRNQRNDFLLGRVLDLQIRRKTKVAADYFINDFLMCHLGTQGDSGTRLVARALRAAFDALKDPAEQQELYNSMMTLRRADGRRWTANEIADELLSGDSQAIFLDALVHEDTRSTAFEFQTEVFDQTVRYRVFQLKSGVLIYAPHGELGRSVVVEDGETRHLRCEGQVVSEKIKGQMG